ncbi:MAG: hypothetical protein A2516_02610 [Alphaproteobacteria bacterium RIFOXYD12_FULL_60_8]|nr:MAG: hypothetical protein A2516_02610 [Alphaproteobacteria bacterium RIFOXYD12_FULL_60_8]
MLSVLPYALLVAGFFLLHGNVLFKGYYRPHGDHTILFFSNFYFLDGIFTDGELPLWQPYRHLGTMNFMALLLFNPLLILLCQAFRWAGGVLGMRSSSMYPVAFLSYMVGFILTFVLPCWLIAREVIKNTTVRWVAVGAALFGSHLFLMIYLGNDMLYYFPFTILFSIRMMRDADDECFIPNLAGFILSLSLALTTSALMNHVLTACIIAGISALLTSRSPWAGLPDLLARLKRVFHARSKRATALLAMSSVVAVGLGAARIALFFRMGEFEIKGRVMQTRLAFLNYSSDTYTYSNHLFQVSDNLLNMFAYLSPLIKSGTPYPMLYFGVIAVSIFLLMFRHIENRRIFNFFLVSAAFILLCSTNPKDGYNFIYPFTYLLNPLLSMGSRHNNLVVLLAAPFAIMAMCMALDRFVSLYSRATYPRHQKVFLFLVISSACSYFVYRDLASYNPRIYIYWYVGLVALIVSMLLYLPRERIFKPHVAIPLVLAVLVVVEIALPLRGYVRSFYRPFPKDGGGYFGSGLPMEDPIRGWPLPTRHSFPSQFNVAEGLNTTNNIYHRMDNAYFKFCSIEGYDDCTAYEKGANIEDMPWLKRATDRLLFVDKIVPVREHEEALRLTKMIFETGKNSQYAVVEGAPSASVLGDISLISENELNDAANTKDVAKAAYPASKTFTIAGKEFKSVGADPDNTHARLYSVSLPIDFPKYLTTNYLNQDYKDISVVDVDGKTYTPTYFDSFREPFRYQIGFQNHRQMVISLEGGDPRGIVISWRDRFAEKGVEILKFSYNKLALKVDAERDSFLIYMDKNASRWKFFLDGARRDVFTTDGVFKGVFVPKGTHSLVFEYRDPFLAASMVIYSLSLFCSWGLLFLLVLSGEGRPIQVEVQR